MLTWTQRRQGWAESAPVRTKPNSFAKPVRYFAALQCAKQTRKMCETITRRCEQCRKRKEFITARPCDVAKLEKQRLNAKLERETNKVVKQGLRKALEKRDYVCKKRKLLREIDETRKEGNYCPSHRALADAYEQQRKDREISNIQARVAKLDQKKRKALERQEKLAEKTVKQPSKARPSKETDELEAERRGLDKKLEQIERDKELLAQPLPLKKARNTAQDPCVSDEEEHMGSNTAVDDEDDEQGEQDEESEDGGEEQPPPEEVD